MEGEGCIKLTTVPRGLEIERYLTRIDACSLETLSPVQDAQTSLSCKPKSGCYPSRI